MTKIILLYLALAVLIAGLCAACFVLPVAGVFLLGNLAVGLKRRMNKG